MTRLEHVQRAWHDKHFEYKRLSEEALKNFNNASTQRGSIQNVLQFGKLPLPPK